jgi:hypothetical protein
MAEAFAALVAIIGVFLFILLCHLTKDDNLPVAPRHPVSPCVKPRKKKMICVNQNIVYVNGRPIHRHSHTYVINNHAASTGLVSPWVTDTILEDLVSRMERNLKIKQQKSQEKQR